MLIDINIPDGESGDWKVENFEVKEKDAEHFNMSLMFQGHGARQIRAGNYVRLVRGGTVVMSNTPAEISDHVHFIRKAKGNVLINGLGIGMCLKAVLEKEEVTGVTVIEKSADVIGLVAPHYQDDRLEIINADAYEYKPPKGVRYDCVWHDIWDFICADNLEEMGKLHRKYGRRCDWQDSWCKWECLQQRREEKHYAY